MTDPFVLAGESYRSRLIVGTGKYRDFAETKRAIDAAGAEIVSVFCMDARHDDESILCKFSNGAIATIISSGYATLDWPKEYMEAMAGDSHVAGQPSSRKVAEYALAKFKSFGLDARIVAATAISEPGLRSSATVARSRAPRSPRPVGRKAERPEAAASMRYLRALRRLQQTLGALPRPAREGGDDGT